MYDDAHVGDAGVDVVGQHEVDQAVAAAEGQRAGVAGAGQLAKAGVGAIGKQNAVQVVHTRSPPFTSSRSMALGGTLAPAPTRTPPATTATPQPVLPSGGAPT